MVSIKKPSPSKSVFSAFFVPVLQTTAAFIVLLVLMATVFTRNAVYKTTVGLWEDAARKSTNKARPHYNLGRLYSDQWRSDEALREYQVAERIDPLDPVTRYNIGNTLLVLGRGPEAIPEYRAALNLQPNYPDALHNLEVAIRIQIDSAVARKDKQAEAAWRNNLGNLFFMRMAFDKSRQEYETALRLAPGFSEAQYNLGKIFDELNRKGITNKE
ncbi:MAG TPA: tetratricopeptide repeat protein [Nitrospirota bacterium]|nr:tetratricopeptide repeat protein [Nitrospirota bacterium]